MDSTYPARRAEHIRLTSESLARVFNAQRTEVISSGALSARWDDVLSSVVLGRNLAVAAEFGEKVARRLKGDFDPALLEPWLTENARITASGINAATFERVQRAQDEPQPVFALGALFTGLATITAANYAQQMVTTAANFGAQDGARAAGAGSKTWKTNSGKPRSIHAALEGETVGFDEPFSNGMAWPGDPSGGPENNANCMCSVEFN